MSVFQTADIHAHGVIQASAGTGKTYTIEQLVVRFFLERKQDPSRLLLVTFTEKATRELREKIRKTLRARAEAAAVNSEEKRILTEVLSRYQELPVSTIHGFARSALSVLRRSYSQADIVADSGENQRAYHEILRHRFPEIFGEEYPEILSALFGYTETGDDPTERIVSAISSVYLEGSDTVLFPQNDLSLEDWLSWKKEYAVTIDSFLKEHKRFIKELEDPAFLEQLKYEVGGRSFSAFNKSFITATLALESTVSDREGILQYLNSFNYQSATKGMDNFRNSVHPAIASFASALNALLECEEKIQIFRQRFISSAVRETMKSSQQLRTTDEVSYNNLISDLAALLKNPVESEKLSARYDAALIDEFQDTDPLQWQIFKTLFLHRGKTLFVVGDPKQSIYQFRGADINTYLAAVEDILAKGGKKYTLDTNYRSSKNFVEACNQFFTGNFFELPSIQYEKVHAEKVESSHPVQNRGSINAVDLAGNNSTHSSVPKTKYFYFIKDEILRMRDAGISPGRTAVLVARNDDGAAVREILREAGIGSLLQGEHSVFHSSEAQLLLDLLTALRDNDDSAMRRLLLSRLFAVPVESMFHGRPSAYFGGLFSMWKSYAEKRDIALLVEMVLHDSQILYEVQRESPLETERSYTNFRHLRDLLSHAMASEKFTLPELVAWLMEKMESAKDEEEVLRIESDDPDKVKLLTIHSSKGLEYDYVFVVPKFNLRTQSPDYFDFAENGRRALSLELNNVEHDKKYGESKEQQTRRLHYVAITRAVHAVYYPFYRKLNKDGSLHSGQGETGRFLYDYLEQGISNKIVVKLEPAGYAQGGAQSTRNQSVNKGKINPITFVPFRERARYFHSFSSLHAREQEHEYIAESDSTRESDESPSGELLQEYVELAHGTTTGIFLHKVMEVLDPALFAEAASVAAVYNSPEFRDTVLALHEFSVLELRNFPEYQSSKDLSFLHPETSALFSSSFRMESLSFQKREILLAESARMYYHSVHAMLPGIQTTLAQIGHSRMLRELEFFAPAEHFQNLMGPQDFMKGSIDLVFEHGGKWYIADYKSNALPNYSDDTITKNVSVHYSLQIQIYSKALEKFLSLRGIGKPAGVFYIYMRGTKAGQGSAIYGEGTK